MVSHYSCACCMQLQQLTSGASAGLIKPLKGAPTGVGGVGALVELAIVVVGCVGGSLNTFHLMFVTQRRFIVALDVGLAIGSVSTASVAVPSTPALTGVDHATWVVKH